MSENQNETPTMEEAVEETRDLIGRMALAIKEAKGSSETINGQDIPNEIRGILGISPVTKTYYDVQSYLSDIGTILKQGGSTQINAQDFPAVILSSDPSYSMYNSLLQWNKINSTILSLSDFKTFYNRANAAYGVDNWNLYATYAIRYGYESEGISIGAVPIDVYMVYGENGYNQGGTFNGHGNDWYPLGVPNVNYECVSMYKRRWNNTVWSTWINKDDTYIGNDNYFQGYGYGWDKYTIIKPKNILTTVDSTNYTGYELNVLSNYPFFFITTNPNSRTDVYTAVKGSDNNIYLCKIMLISNAHYWQPVVSYPPQPSGITFSNNYYETTSGGVMTASDCTLGGTPSNYPSLQVFSSYQEAYKALTGKYYAPDGNKYTYYYYSEGLDYRQQTFGVDSYSNVKMVGRQENNIVVTYYYNGSNLITVGSRQDNKYPYGQNIMWISGYYVYDLDKYYTNASWSFYSGNTTNLEVFPSTTTDQELIEYLTT